MRLPIHRQPSLLLRFTMACAAVLTIAACDRGVGQATSFPSDEVIVKALRANFTEDPNGGRARDMLQTLGGAKGELDYRVRRVIYRNGSFEVHYDIGLRMGQAGTESLKQLYASMIPEAARGPLPEQTLPAYERWLNEESSRIEKTNPAQAEALRATLKRLGSCYGTVKAGDRVDLMNAVRALLSPERSGWYAEKMDAPALDLQCLPL